MMTGACMESPLRVFLPHTCLYGRHGYLVGLHDVQQNIICVTAVLHTASQASDRKREIFAKKDDSFGILGSWQSVQSETSHHAVAKNGSLWLTLVSRTGGSVPEVIVTDTKGDILCDNKVMVILYDSSDLLSSYFLLEHALASGNGVTGMSNGMSRDIIGTVIRESWKHLTLVEDIPLDAKVWNDLIAQEKGWIQSVIDSGIAAITACIHWPLYAISKITDNRLAQSSTFRTLSSIPCVMCQIAQRTANMAAVLPTQKQTPMEKLRWLNSLSCVGVDVLLGITLLLMLMCADNDPAASSATHIMAWAQDVVGQLQRLIHWLMGSPAGLKLNSQLDQFLGRFFLFHIQLWTAYLQMLEPVLPSLLWGIAYAGVLGFSLQMALLQDLVAMLTLHIYCFYVYAARLYSLQVSGLGSLWRLFRGKKWNVLRERVDSARYDVDQLFMGTLLFTILLFLLPTTAMYYVVFTGLRLVVVTLQGMLYKLRCMLNHLPIFALVGRMCNTKPFTASVYFHVVPTPQNSATYLSMKLQPASWSQVWRSGGTSNSINHTHSWSDLLQSLMKGRLIYPWIRLHDPR